MSTPAGLSANLIGRETELHRIAACVAAGRNVLLEGPVGVGKTHLAIRVAEKAKRPVFRVDGDSRYTEQKLTGWFDPPSILKHGYNAKSFFPGPLVEAMRAGGVLFINELNRLPEGVQNILLPAIDERMIQVPRLGEILAKKGFLVIATQNPKEFVATSHLSEAILDRFELVALSYQSEADELKIVTGRVKQTGKKAADAAWFAEAAVALTRATRNHERIKRGASVRAAIAIAEIALELHSDDRVRAFVDAALVALPTRIELDRDPDGAESPQAALEALIRELAEQALAKKKS